MFYIGRCEPPKMGAHVDIPDGYHDIRPGKLATVVTHLDMRSAPVARPDPNPAPWQLERALPDIGRYRALYRTVGADYLWWSRLRLDDAALAAILRASAVQIYVLRSGERDAGIIEFDFGALPDCEIVSFGVERTLIGTGAGRWLMNRALLLAWQQPIERVWLHTCSLDHPRALDFYTRSGFRPYRRQVEVFEDPRLLGDLPRDAAPTVPLL